jgi:2-polyprenyl-6-methoxyphenol hydroxylase-like FAD-dependent oxidoreductase
MTKPALVVGAGPVGITMASELARYGVAVRIVDKAAQRTDKSKALVLWSRTLELLDRGGGSAPFCKAGFEVDAVNFIAGAKVIGRVSMESVQSPYPFALMLPQSDTERLLEERLSNLGVRIEREVELASFRSGDDGVEAVLRHVDGHEETVSVEWLIGCDGAHSAVRHGLGATFAGETLDSDWMLADIHMKGYPCPDSEASVYWHRDGVFVIFPISPGRYRILADLPLTGGAHSPAPTLEEAQAVIERRGPPGLVAFDPIWLAGFRINGRKVSNYRWGRTFLAGDAAHVHSPAGGQGMNTGMQDAFNLAWKLAMVVRGMCDERLLDSYSPERSGVGDEVLKSAERLTKVGTLRSPVARTIRNLVGHVAFGLAPVQHQFANQMTEVAIGYPDSPLNAASAKSVKGPRPGQRIVADQPFGAGDTPRFALIAEDDVQARAVLQRHAGLLEPELRKSLNGPGIWLVRPDGYVAAAVGAGEWQVIDSCLSKIAARAPEATPGAELGQGG